MSEEKIVDLEELAKICQEEKEKGKKIVHCHGCFDLLHPGHIRHFKAAKSFGDILIVTITQDKFVRKGPGRPVFNEQLRLESIASLEIVDYVALNKWETAIETLKLLKPSFYVKGKDYSDRSGDVTGNIYLEEEAVKEGGGGEIKFTDEISFSSSKIINKYFTILSREAMDYINRMKKEFSSEDIINIIKKLKDLKVLVIGDAILDEYIFCKAMGKPEKASVVSSKYLYHETYAGGSLVVANHVAGFVDNVHLITCLGKKNSRQEFIAENLKKNVNSKFFFRNDTPTIIKRRYLDDWNKAKLFEVSDLNDDFIDRDNENEIINYLDELIPQIDMVLIADFGHGLITTDIQKKIVEKAPFCAVNAQTNSANYGFNLITKYNNVDYISIDEKELRLPYRTKYGQLEPLIEKLSNDTNCKKINITLGKSGTIYYQEGNEYFVPVFSDNIVDTVGAGDAVLSITSLLAKQNVNPDLIPFVGNAAGALAIKVMGNKESIDAVDLFKFINYIMK
jgi:rfaE bifunctional protein nucleotidyltransferase chain/domain